MVTGPTEAVKRARKLRSKMSLPEVLLWREMRKRLKELKFRRQHPAGIYVLDFFCAKAKLAIEIDGFAHDSEDASRHDSTRSHFLRAQGVATLRVPARVVLEETEAAMARIVDVCQERVLALSNS